MSSANDVLDMSMLRGVRGVGGVCMCLSHIGVGERIGFCISNPVGTERLWYVCLCLGCDGVRGQWVVGFGKGLGGWGGVICV